MVVKPKKGIFGRPRSKKKFQKVGARRTRAQYEGKYGRDDEYNERRRGRGFMQRFNEVVTGTNYIGPGTDTVADPVSAFDALGKVHDEEYAFLGNLKRRIYLDWNVADEKMHNAMHQPGVKPSVFSPRQRWAYNVADKLWWLKKTFRPHDPTPVWNGTEVSENVDHLEMAYGRRKRTFGKRRRGTYAKRRKGSVRSGSRSTTSYRRKSTYRRRKMGAKKIYKRKVRVSSQIQKVPIKIMNLGYGTFACSANLTRIESPKIFAVYDNYDASSWFAKDQGTSEFYTKMLVKCCINVKMRNVANHTMNFKLFQVRMKRKYNPVGFWGTLDPIVAANVDTADDATIADTQSESYINVDMSKVLSASTSTSAYWANGSVQLDSIIKFSQYPRVQRQFYVKKVIDVNMLPGGVMNYKLSPKPIIYDNSKDTSTNWRHTVYYIAETSAYPATYTTDSTVIGTPGGRIAVTWDKLQKVYGMQSEKTRQIPPIYISNGRTAQTSFKVQTETVNEASEDVP